MTFIEISGLNEDLEEIKLLSEEIFQEKKIQAKTEIFEFRSDSIDTQQIQSILQFTFSGVGAVVGLINLILRVKEKRSKPSISTIIKTNNGKVLDIKISGCMADSEIKKYQDLVQEFTDDFLVTDEATSLRNSKTLSESINIEKVNLLFKELAIKLNKVKKPQTSFIEDDAGKSITFSLEETDLVEILKLDRGDVFYLHIDDIKAYQNVFYVLQRESILGFHEISTDIRILDRKNIFVGDEIEKLSLFEEIACNKDFIFFKKLK